MIVSFPPRQRRCNGAHNVGIYRTCRSPYCTPLEERASTYIWQIFFQRTSLKCERRWARS